jgi:hypothetical protein
VQLLQRAFVLFSESGIALGFGIGVRDFVEFGDPTNEEGWPERSPASGSGGFTPGRKIIAREGSREKRIREWEQQWRQKTGEPRRRRGCLRGNHGGNGRSEADSGREAGLGIGIRCRTGKPD